MRNRSLGPTCDQGISCQKLILQERVLKQGPNTSWPDTTHQLQSYLNDLRLEQAAARIALANLYLKEETTEAANGLKHQAHVAARIQNSPLERRIIGFQ